MARPILAGHGLSVSASVEEIAETAPRQTKGGGVLFGCRVRVVTRLRHVSGEWLEASAWGEGLDSGDKAAFKATTGARKYGLASVLGLATTDDPERDEAENGSGHDAQAGNGHGRQPATAGVTVVGSDGRQLRPAGGPGTTRDEGQPADIGTGKPPRLPNWPPSNASPRTPVSPRTGAGGSVTCWPPEPSAAGRPVA